MADYPRYAIYYAPSPGSDLDRFGAQLLGYDAYSGEELPFPNDIIRMAPDWRDLTKDPRKYGFHATLKAPMSLAPGKTEPEILAACESFADKSRPIRLSRLWSVRSADLSLWCLLSRRPSLNGLPRIVRANSIRSARRSHRRIVGGVIPLT